MLPIFSGWSNIYHFNQKRGGSMIKKKEKVKDLLFDKIDCRKPCKELQQEFDCSLVFRFFLHLQC